MKIIGYTSQRVNLSYNENQEIVTILTIARKAALGRNISLIHLDSKLGIIRYVKKANEIRSYQMEGDKILDWGCGHGQMAYLLHNRGLDVTCFDIDKNDSQELPLLNLINKKVHYSEDKIRIPFDASSFDAVLSSGVLEHVEDIALSLKEIYRILKPQGVFYVFAFPNKYSYIEYLCSKRKGVSHHEVKYSRKQLKRELITAGFDVIKIGYDNILPKNFFGFDKLRRIIDSLSFYGLLDRILLRLPIVNLFSTDIKCIAMKNRCVHIRNKEAIYVNAQ